MIAKFIGFITGICLLLCSCRNSVSDVLEYTQEHQNELEKHYNGKALKGYFKYIPPDLAAWRDHQLSEDTLSFQQYKEPYQQAAIFEFRLVDKAEGKSILKKIKEDINNDFINTYYNHQCNKDIKLISGRDTLPCAYFHAIQQGGSKDELLFNCEFDLNVSQNAKTIEIQYYDRMFGLDTLYFHFTREDLQHIPAITK